MKTTRFIKIATRSTPTTGTPKDQDRLGTNPIHTDSLSYRFHVIGMLFTETELKYYHDGKLVHSYDATEIDESGLPTQAQFKYVRLLELVAD